MSTFLNQLQTGDSIKDFRHASRLFVDGLYRLSPKVGTLFHVFFDIDPAVTLDRNDQIEFGMLAKSVELPKFSIQSKTLNSYNRKAVIQERINYEPISLTFHDDSANIVRDFWRRYYTFYYRDADNQESVYENKNLYDEIQSGNWGFGPTPGTSKFLKSIRIYSLHQKNYSEYILLNPMVTSFSHGTHQYGEYAPVESSMQVSYEAVQYSSGEVKNGQVQGFADIHYDKEASPLTAAGGGTATLLGPGGLIDSAGDIAENIASGNYGAAAIGALRTARNLKNTNLRRVASEELKQVARDILRGQNKQSTIFVPTKSSILSGISKTISNSGRIDL